MRTMIIEDARLARLLALVFREDFEHADNIRPGTPAGEFAIAECAGPTFAEKVIALRLRICRLRRRS